MSTNGQFFRLCLCKAGAESDGASVKSTIRYIIGISALAYRC